MHRDRPFMRSWLGEGRGGTGAHECVGRGYFTRLGLLLAQSPGAPTISSRHGHTRRNARSRPRNRRSRWAERRSRRTGQENRPQLGCRNRSSWSPRFTDSLSRRLASIRLMSRRGLRSLHDRTVCVSRLQPLLVLTSEYRSLQAKRRSR